MGAVISLSKEEKSSLRELERTISNGVKSFVEVGNALKAIRDGRLYREQFKTFELYVKDRWNFDRTRAYQLIDAAEIRDDLSKIFDKSPKAREIETESHMKELANVSIESLPVVIDKAVEIAGEDRITAKVLREARQAVVSPVAARDEPSPVPTKSEEDASTDLQEFKKFWRRCTKAGKAAIRVWIDENYLND